MEKGDRKVKAEGGKGREKWREGEVDGEEWRAEKGGR